MGDTELAIKRAAYWNIERAIKTLKIVNSKHFNAKLLDEDHDQDEEWLSDYGDEDTLRDIQIRIKQIIERDIIRSTEVLRNACERLGEEMTLPHGYPEELR